MAGEVAGSARLVLVDGLAHLDEASAVFEAMLAGWERQQMARLLGAETIGRRLALVRRFRDFAEAYPWCWTPGDAEDFVVSLMSGGRRFAPSTIRGYQVCLRSFCDYLVDVRYDWAVECQRRFDRVPVQIFHEWNTVAHLVDYEGAPARRPLTYEELQVFFDHADARVGKIVAAGRKGGLAALRDAQIFKTLYAFGLRCNELAQLDVADLRHNSAAPQWGRYGSVHVRYGKATRGSPPKRRMVLAVPEFDWAIAGLRQWVEQARDRFSPGAHPALWVTERVSRVSVRYIDTRFAQLRDEIGLPAELTPHCLRHSYVTHLIELGYPERFVQEQVGHCYASTTAIYTSVSDDFKNQVLATALARIYGG